MEIQVALTLRQADEGMAVGKIGHQMGSSKQTYNRWRKKYRGLMPSEMKHLRQLAEENHWLKRRWPTYSLEEAMLQEVMLEKLWHVKE